MSIKNLSRVLLTVFVAVATCVLFHSSDVTAGVHGTRLLDQTGCCQRCPACDHVCHLEAELVDEEKPCFEVESKVICIPRVVFPWQIGKGCFPFCKKRNCGSCDACDGRGCSSCVNNGARTRKVCVLKTDKHTCPKCEYTWTAEKKPCAAGCNSSCCDTGCDSGSTAVPYEAGMSYAEPQFEGYPSVHVHETQQELPTPIAQ